MTRINLPVVLGLTVALAAGPATRSAGAASRGPAPQTAGATPPCIAIVPPSVRGVEGDATQMSKSLSEMFASYLNGPSLKSMARSRRGSPTRRFEEAKQKSCGNVLLTSFLSASAEAVARSARPRPPPPKALCGRCRIPA